MRYLIIGFLALLAGCNGGSNTNTPTPTLTQQQVTEQINAAIAKIQEPPSEATQVAALQASIKKLQLIGNAHGVATAERTLAIGEAAATSVDFGPCTDMGVLVGFTNAGNNVGEGVLSASYQAFKTCTGYMYETSVGTGDIKTSNRIFWDGPNCTGNMLEWEAGGSGYNTQTLQDGVVFINPADGTTQLMVKSGQIPKPILFQSVWVLDNPGCQSDIETQLMYQVSPNDVNVTGVPNKTIGNFSLSPP